MNIIVRKPTEAEKSNQMMNEIVRFIEENADAELVDVEYLQRERLNDLRILIDADACPVVDLTVNITKTYNLDCLISYDTLV